PYKNAWVAREFSHPRLVSEHCPSADHRTGINRQHSKSMAGFCQPVA
ncbi:uncharacterized protein METZ01_LOCUS96098, partial [marine metagenome]